MESQGNGRAVWYFLLLQSEKQNRINETYGRPTPYCRAVLKLVCLKIGKELHFLITFVKVFWEMIWLSLVRQKNIYWRQLVPYEVKRTKVPSASTECCPFAWPDACRWSGDTLGLADHSEVFQQEPTVSCKFFFFFFFLSAVFEFIERTTGTVRVHWSQK